jgi:hypothetical protein
MVTNVEFEFRDPQGGPPDCGDRLLFAGFPREGVALAFMPIVGDSIPGFFFEQPDTVLPLAPELLVSGGGIRGGPTETFQSVWHDGGWIGTVRRFVGPDASAADVVALDRMLATFRVRGAPRWIHDEISPKNELSDLRISLTRPTGWNLRTYPRWSVIDAPNPIAALESPGIREGSCRPFPSDAWVEVGRLRVPSTLVLISDASDSWSVPDFGPRPEHFRFEDALEAGKGGCGRNVRTVRFGFEAAGRQIYVDVASSSNWSTFTDQPEMLRYILDSIEISKA